MIVINFFGGAGVGKSTLAAETFAKLKKGGYNVELVTEFAKSLTWENRHIALENQFYVTAKQLHNLKRLEGKVDYVVTDAPLIQGIVYAEGLPNEYAVLTNFMFSRYDNMNFFVRREVEFHSAGRNQDLEGAEEFDKAIKGIIERFDHYYAEISPKQFDIETWIEPNYV